MARGLLSKSNIMTALIAVVAVGLTRRFWPNNPLGV